MSRFCLSKLSGVWATIASVINMKDNVETNPMIMQIERDLLHADTVICAVEFSKTKSDRHSLTPGPSHSRTALTTQLLVKTYSGGSWSDGGPYYNLGSRENRRKPQGEKGKAYAERAPIS